MTHVVVIGAGPAGMAAGLAAREAGARVTLLDQAPAAGGQIWRGVGAHRQPSALGDDYAGGAARTRALTAADIDYRPGMTVWQVEPDLTVSASGPDGPLTLRADRLIAATGAIERPVPIPGWTLPGVMTAGAAQILLKTGDMVPEGRFVLAGAGPLLLLVAHQLLSHGAPPAAIVETTGPGDYLDAAPLLPAALGRPGDLSKGIRWRRDLKRAGVSFVGSARDLRVDGADRATALVHSRGRIAADLVLLHDGVVPNTQLTRLLRLPHAWHAGQRYWYPVTGPQGRVAGHDIWVAGDGASVGGWRVAEAAGRLAGLSAGDAPIARIREAGEALDDSRLTRPLLDALFRPLAALQPIDDAAIVCRCEEVTAGAIRAAAASGAIGPNQMKAFVRAGMGACQGRQCGLAVTELIAETRGLTPEAIGSYRIRAPLYPLRLGDIADTGDPA